MNAPCMMLTIDENNEPVPSHEESSGTFLSSRLHRHCSSIEILVAARDIRIVLKRLRIILTVRNLLYVV